MRLKTKTPGYRLATNFKTLVVVSIAAGLTLVLSGCGAVDKLKELEAANNYDLPAVENPETAASILVKKADNPSEVKFIHLMKLDGETFMKLEEGDRREFQLDAGTYQLKVTCHNIPNPKVSSFPVNLSVVDGADDLELTVEEGDELCLKVSKPLLTCAKVEESALSVCR